MNMYTRNYTVFTQAKTHHLIASSLQAAILTALEFYPTERIYRVVENPDWPDDHEE